MTALARCRCGHPPGFSAKRVSVGDAARSQRLDPTGTLDIRSAFAGQMDRRWTALKRVVLETIDRNDVLGLNSNRAQFSAHAANFSLQPFPCGDKVKAFQAWLDAALAQVIFANNGAWMVPYLRTAADRAQARAAKLLGRIVGRDGEQVDAVTSLAVTELQGIMEAVSQKAVRAMADGHIGKQRASRVARDIAAVITDIGRKRGRDLAQTIVVKMFAVASIDAFKAAGVRKVGTTPERIRIAKGPHGLAVVKDSVPVARIGRCVARDAKSSRKAPSARKQREIEKKQAELAKLDEVDVLTAGDDDVCEVCEDISNEGPYDINEALSLIPAHPNCRCFLPGTVVEGEVIGASKSWYAGPCVELHTAGGKRLRLTINHPVMTSQGMIPAGAIYEGGHLVSQRGEIGRSAADDVDHGPTEIEKIYETLSRFGVVEVNPSAVDLYGDGAFLDGYVEMVFSNAELLRHAKAYFAQGVGEIVLMPADHSSGVGIGAGNLSLALPLAHAAPFDALLFGRRADFDAVLAKQKANRAALNFVGARQHDDGSPASVSADDSENVVVIDAVKPNASADLNSDAAQSSQDRIHGDAVSFGESSGGISGAVILDEVILVKRFDFRGHVYDLQTATGYILAEGIATANCAFVPVSDERFAEVERVD